MSTWRILLGLVVICLVAGEIGEDFSDEDDDELEIEKRNVLTSGLSATSLALGIAEKFITVINAGVELDRKVKDGSWAIIKFSLTNLCNWTLSDFEFEEFEGKVDDETFDVEEVKPGQRMMLGGYQTVDYGRTEAAIYFDVGDDWQCFFYWQVSDRNRIAPRGSELALGCYPQNEYEDMQNKLEKYLGSWKGATYLPLISKKYEKKIEITRFCGENAMPFCIEGSMKTEFRSKARVAIFPKKVADIAEDFQGLTSQKKIDQRLKKVRLTDRTKSKSPNSSGNLSNQPSLYLFSFVGFVAAASLAV